MRLTDFSPGMEPPFTLDEEQLRKSREANLRRLHTLQIPAMRVAGFVLLWLVVLLYHLAGGYPPRPQLLAALLLFNLAYGAVGWLVMQRWYGRTGRLDLTLVFMHIDLLVWVVNLHQIADRQGLLVALLLLVRVADQTGFGFRRALYFNHAVLAVYLGYSVWQDWSDPTLALPWGERIGVACILYVAGLYLSLAGLVTQRLRNRAREAGRAARELIGQLARQTQDLQAQAQALERARAAAERASATQSRFLQTMSHELRTPLNGVMGMLQLLQATPLDDAQRQRVRIALNSSHGLLALIDELLDIASYTTERLPLRPEPVALAPLVRALVAQVRPADGDNAPRLHCEVDPALEQPVQVDPRRLRQLLLHLLRTAFKGCGERGELDMRLRCVHQDAQTLVLVLQLACSRAAAATAVEGPRSPAELSPGLAIAREIVALLGGQLQLNQEAGTGWRLDMELTLDRPAPPVPPPPATHS